MPSSEYASASGGALRMKGAKVEKHKKKHKKDRQKREKRDQDKAERAASELGSGSKDIEDKNKDKAKDKDEGTASDDDDPYGRMTPAERRFAEAQDQKIRTLMHATPDEAKAARPDLFKSHKERLADLNTYLSRLSEHNDMPKIGPG